MPGLARHGAGRRVRDRGSTRRSQGNLQPSMPSTFAVSSDFELDRAPGRRQHLRSCRRSSSCASANWGADTLHREANDLVVHVRSMTQIDPAHGEFVKGQLAFGSNSFVYHTNYFAHGATAGKADGVVRPCGRQRRARTGSKPTPGANGRASESVARARRRRSEG